MRAIGENCDAHVCVVVQFYLRTIISPNDGRHLPDRWYDNQLKGTLMATGFSLQPCELLELWRRLESLQAVERKFQAGGKKTMHSEALSGYNIRIMQTGIVG